MIRQEMSDSQGKTKRFVKNLDRRIANSGKFSSDRTIAEYIADIWKVKLCPVV